MDEFETTYQELRKKLWITSGARFQAAARLARRDRLSTLSIAGLSIVAIALGLIDPHITAADRAIAPLSTAAITATISIFVLVISLIEANNQTQVRADRLHDSAVRISEVRTALETRHARTAGATDPDWASLDDLKDSYERLLKECPFNHEVIDYLRFMVNHRTSREFVDATGPRMGWLRAQYVKAQYLASAASLSILSWIVVATVLVFSFRWQLCVG